MIFQIELSIKALEDIELLKKSGDNVSLKKLIKLLNELREHPENGTGKPEKLKNNLTGYWSRRISDKHRLIYRIDNDIVTVYVVQCFGHYSDK